MISLMSWIAFIAFVVFVGVCIYALHRCEKLDESIQEITKSCILDRKHRKGH